MAKKKHKPSKLGKPAKEHIEVAHVDVKAQEEYYAYSVAMIEDRFVIGNLDGLKPVARRALWAIHKLGLNSKVKHDKSAKAVGETIASYHPHGDTACYEAMVTQANSAMKTIDGDGNWGTMMDPNAAAYRYTNLRLSKYGDLCFFDKFYLPAVEMIPNFDDSKMEPLNLPTMLPNALLNGAFGMGPGVNTRTIAFTLKSVVKVLKQVLADGGTATVDHCMDLEPTSEYGGVVFTKDKETRKELRDFYKKGIGTVTFFSQATDPDKNNSVRFYRFAPLPSNLEGKFTKISAIKGVQRIEDDSENKDPFRAAIKVTFAKSLRGKELASALEDVEDELAVEQRLDVKVTDRVLGANGEGYTAALRSSNVPTLINDWLAYRIGLEKKACAYWIGKRNERIAYLKLMLKAIAHLDVIFKALKLDDTAGYMVKHMKITPEQAEIILGLAVRQLKKLEVKTINAEISDLNKEIAGYEDRIKKPKKYILGHIDQLYNELKGEAARQEHFKD